MPTHTDSPDVLLASHAVTRRDRFDVQFKTCRTRYRSTTIMRSSSVIELVSRRRRPLGDRISFEQTSEKRRRICPISSQKRPFTQLPDHYDPPRRLCCFILLSPIIVWHTMIVVYAITGINVTNHRVNGCLRTRYESCLVDQETPHYSHFFAALEVVERGILCVRCRYRE